MIDFNYTAPELLPWRIQEVLDAPNEPHRIGDVVYVPMSGDKLNSRTKRIYMLEELVLDLYADLMEYGCTPNAHRANYKPRFEALGIEAGDDVQVR